MNEYYYNFRHVCDRCNRPFRAMKADEQVCRCCFLGALSPVDRAVALVSPWRP